MVVMGSCGRSSILVMGTMDVSGPYHCPSILEVGLHGQSLIVVVGAGCEKRGVVTFDIVFIISPHC